MSEPKQYFELNEEVILQSKYHKDLNGDAIIVGIFADYGLHNDGSQKTENCGCSYRLNISDRRWCQCCIRKKHKPGEDFEDLLESLNNPKELSQSEILEFFEVQE